MEERAIHLDLMVITHDQSAEVAQPGEGAFDFPSSFVSSKFATVLGFRFFATASMRADQLDATLAKSLSQGVGVGRAIVDQTLGILLRSTESGTWHGDLFEGRFDQRDFVGRCRVQVDSKRNTFAVDHHHPLRALAAFGFADAQAPFFAEAKLPSAKASDHSSWPSVHRVLPATPAKP